MEEGEEIRTELVLSLDFKTPKENEFQWRNIYIKQFGVPTYPPPMPPNPATTDLEYPTRTDIPDHFSLEDDGGAGSPYGDENRKSSRMYSDGVKTLRRNSGGAPRNVLTSSGQFSVLQGSKESREALEDSTLFASNLFEFLLPKQKKNRRCAMNSAMPESLEEYSVAHSLILNEPTSSSLGRSHSRGERGHSSHSKRTGSFGILDYRADLKEKINPHNLPRELLALQHNAWMLLMDNRPLAWLERDITQKGSAMEKVRSKLLALALSPTTSFASSSWKESSEQMLATAAPLPLSEEAAGNRIFESFSPYFAVISSPNVLGQLKERYLSCRRIQQRGRAWGGPEAAGLTPSVAQLANMVGYPLFSQYSSWKETYEHRKVWSCAPFSFFLMYDTSYNYAHISAVFVMFELIHQHGHAHSVKCLESGGDPISLEDASRHLLRLQEVRTMVERRRTLCPLLAMQKTMEDILLAYEQSGSRTTLTMMKQVCGFLMDCILEPEVSHRFLSQEALFRQASFTVPGLKVAKEKRNSDKGGWSPSGSPLNGGPPSQGSMDEEETRDKGEEAVGEDSERKGVAQSRLPPLHSRGSKKRKGSSSLAANTEQFSYLFKAPSSFSSPTSLPLDVLLSNKRFSEKELDALFHLSYWFIDAATANSRIPIDPFLLPPSSNERRYDRPDSREGPGGLLASSMTTVTTAGGSGGEGRYHAPHSPSSSSTTSSAKHLVSEHLYIPGKIQAYAAVGSIVDVLIMYQMRRAALLQRMLKNMGTSAGSPLLSTSSAAVPTTGATAEMGVSMSSSIPPNLSTSSHMGGGKYKRGHLHARNDASGTGNNSFSTSATTVSGGVGNPRSSLPSHSNLVAGVPTSKAQSSTHPPASSSAAEVDMRSLQLSPATTILSTPLILVTTYIRLHGAGWLKHIFGRLFNILRRESVVLYVNRLDLEDPFSLPSSPSFSHQGARPSALPFEEMSSKSSIEECTSSGKGSRTSVPPRSPMLSRVQPPPSDRASGKETENEEGGVEDGKGKPWRGREGTARRPAGSTFPPSPKNDMGAGATTVVGMLLTDPVEEEHGGPSNFSTGGGSATVPPGAPDLRTVASSEVGRQRSSSPIPPPPLAGLDERVELHHGGPFPSSPGTGRSTSSSGRGTRLPSNAPHGSSYQMSHPTSPSSSPFSYGATPGYGGVAEKGGPHPPGSSTTNPLRLFREQIERLEDLIAQDIIFVMSEFFSSLHGRRSATRLPQGITAMLTQFCSSIHYHVLSNMVPANEVNRSPLAIAYVHGVGELLQALKKKQMTAKAFRPEAMRDFHTTRLITTIEQLRLSKFILFDCWIIPALNNVVSLGYLSENSSNHLRWNIDAFARYLKILVNGPFTEGDKRAFQEGGGETSATSVWNGTNTRHSSMATTTVIASMATAQAAAGGGGGGGVGRHYSRSSPPSAGSVVSPHSVPARHGSSSLLLSSSRLGPSVPPPATAAPQRRGHFNAGSNSSNLNATLHKGGSSSAVMSTGAHPKNATASSPLEKEKSHGGQGGGGEGGNGGSASRVPPFTVSIPCYIAGIYDVSSGSLVRLHSDTEAGGLPSTASPMGGSPRRVSQEEMDWWATYRNSPETWHAKELAGGRGRLSEPSFTTLDQGTLAHYTPPSSAGQGNGGGGNISTSTVGSMAAASFSSTAPPMSSLPPGHHSIATRVRYASASPGSTAPGTGAGLASTMSTSMGSVAPGMGGSPYTRPSQVANSIGKSLFAKNLYYRVMDNASWEDMSTRMRRLNERLGLQDYEPDDVEDLGMLLGGGGGAMGGGGTFVSVSSTGSSGEKAESHTALPFSPSYTSETAGSGGLREEHCAMRVLDAFCRRASTEMATNLVVSEFDVLPTMAVNCINNVYETMTGTHPLVEQAMMDGVFPGKMSYSPYLSCLSGVLLHPKVALQALDNIYKNSRRFYHTLMQPMRDPTLLNMVSALIHNAHDLPVVDSNSLAPLLATVPAPPCPSPSVPSPHVVLHASTGREEGEERFLYEDGSTSGRLGSRGSASGERGNRSQSVGRGEVEYRSEMDSRPSSSNNSILRVQSSRGSSRESSAGGAGSSAGGVHGGRQGTSLRLHEVGGRSKLSDGSYSHAQPSVWNLTSGTLASPLPSKPECTGGGYDSNDRKLSASLAAHVKLYEDVRKLETQQSFLITGCPFTTLSTKLLLRRAGPFSPYRILKEGEAAIQKDTGNTPTTFDPWWRAMVFALCVKAANVFNECNDGQSTRFEEWCRSQLEVNRKEGRATCQTFLHTKGVESTVKPTPGGRKSMAAGGGAGGVGGGASGNGVGGFNGGGAGGGGGTRRKRRRVAHRKSMANNITVAAAAAAVASSAAAAGGNRAVQGNRKRNGRKGNSGPVRRAKRPTNQKRGEKESSSGSKQSSPLEVQQQQGEKGIGRSTSRIPIRVSKRSTSSAQKPSVSPGGARKTKKRV